MSSDFAELCKLYAKTLSAFNQVHSLSRYEGESLNLQIQDSIAPLELFPQIYEAKSAIDVGSGAGFPGLFLAMKMQKCQWLLFEPIAKKASFLSFCVAELGLQNVKICAQKIQNAAKFKADLITSRALTNANELISLCAGFYDENSHFLLYKGSSAKAEIEGLNASVAKGQGNRNYVLLGGAK